MHLKIECPSGVSGDMLVGALVDLGASKERVRSTLSGFAKVSFRKVDRSGVKATKFNVDFKPSSHDYVSLLRIVDCLKVSPYVRRMSKRILNVLAMVESKVHNVPLSGVHLHEAVDCVVDAVAFSVAFEDLGLKGSRVFCPMVNVGYLAPASELIVREHGIPIRFVSKEELATPTGLAVLAAVVSDFSGIHLAGVRGYGAGYREFKQPNVLSAVLGASLCILETNVDDCTPEQVSHAVAVLMKGGALDVHVIPCLMKKGRLGYLIRVLTDDAESSSRILMRETGTLGVRVFDVDRRFESPREIKEFVLRFGGRAEKVRVKKSAYSLKPEYDDCAKVALKHGIPLREVQKRAKNAKNN